MAAYAIRRISSLDELRAVFDIVGSQFEPKITHHDRARFADVERGFPRDRSLMLVLVDDGTIAGGVFGFRREHGVTLRMIALHPSARGKGLGRRLVHAFEVAAMQLGARGIALGASADSKGFYERLGYHGRSSMHKDLPLPGRVLELRLRKLAADLGDLDTGVVVATP